MFFRSHCRDLTMCQFDRPPAVSLDLGCGNGYWAIEAAMQWKVRTNDNTTPVSHMRHRPARLWDLTSMPTSPSCLLFLNIRTSLPASSGFMEICTLSSYVKQFICDACHVVSLDGLPFPPSSFDFIRIVNIGLGVPEDEVINFLHFFLKDPCANNNSGNGCLRFDMLME